MTDSEIIQALIDRDNHVTQQFFFVRCRPLFTAIIRLVFSYPVDYDELVNELYNYLMDNDCARLRQFQFRSSVYQWIKVVATRFFIRHRDSMIENSSKEPLYEVQEREQEIDSVSQISDHIDVGRLLDMMENRRYAHAIRRLIIDDIEPEQYADEIGVSVDNLYNIKKRAMAAFARIALKYYSYGK